MTETIDRTALRAAYPGLQFTVAKGNLYVYERATKTPIKARPIGSPAFNAEVKRARQSRPNDRSQPGTLAACIELYRQSGDYRSLSPRSRKDYDGVLYWVREAAHQILLRKFTPGDVKRMIERAAELKKRHFANYLLVVLRLVLDHAVLESWIERNPARVEGIKKIRRPRDMPEANRPWWEREREVVLAEATGGVQATIAIAMFTGMREGDALRLSEPHYDGAWLRWNQGKTGELVEMPVHPRLKAILDPIVEARRQARDRGDPAPLRLVTGIGGRPYTNDGFRSMMWRLITRLEREGKVEPGLTFHGLRHTAAIHLAEAGASQEQIMAFLSHKTAAMSHHYTRRAGQRRLAAAVAVLYPAKEDE